MLVGLNRKIAMDLEIAKYALKVSTCEVFLIANHHTISIDFLDWISNLGKNDLRSDQG